MKYEALFFDIDDTIFDYAKSADKALRATCEKMHIPFKSDYFTQFMHFDKKYWDMQKSGEITIPEVVVLREKAMSELLGCGEEFDLYSHTFFDELGISAVPVDGAPEIIRILNKKGYKLYTASNGFYKMQKSRLKTAGLLDYFSDVFVSDILGYEKPNGAFLTEALRRSGIQKDRALMIGDSIKADITAAENAGIDSCFFDFTQSGAKSGTFSVTSLLDLDLFL